MKLEGSHTPQQLHKKNYIHTRTHIIDPPLGGSMEAGLNDKDDRAGLRGYVQFNKYTYIHTYIHTHVQSNICTWYKDTHIHTITS